MGIIRTSHLGYEYIRRDEEGKVEELKRALDDLNLEIKEGDFVAVLGRNGSGKSTLAKHINALLCPTEGTIWIGGMDTADEDEIWNIRKTAGMVFQNPDNQIIASLVEDDVGFGPENIGVPTEEIWERVEESLKAVGMTAYAQNSPNRLSGGQKQRVAIAGVMAMKPRCIVLDEPTAMLDPQGRREVIKTIRELNKREHITVILITHYMEETVDADRVIVMGNGCIVLDGTPRSIFTQLEIVKSLGLTVPQVTELASMLRQKGFAVPDGVLTEDELVEAVMQLAAGKKE